MLVAKGANDPAGLGLAVAVVRDGNEIKKVKKLVTAGADVTSADAVRAAFAKT